MARWMRCQKRLNCRRRGGDGRDRAHEFGGERRVSRSYNALIHGAKERRRDVRRLPRRSQSCSVCTRHPGGKLVPLGFAVKTLRRGKSQVKVLFVRLV